MGSRKKYSCIVRCTKEQFMMMEKSGIGIEKLLIFMVQLFAEGLLEVAEVDFSNDDLEYFDFVITDERNLELFNKYTHKIDTVIKSFFCEPLFLKYFEIAKSLVVNNVMDIDILVNLIQIVKFKNKVKNI